MRCDRHRREPTPSTASAAARFARASASTAA
jgi:hypothetical protein